MNYQLTGHPENLKSKHYFKERLSFRCNIILKLLSPFHICFVSKSIFESEDSLFYFLYHRS